MSQPPPIQINADRAKQIGYKAGQLLSQEKQGLSQHDLMFYVNEHYTREGIPMALFSWYRDGVIEGYREKGKAQ